MSLTAPEVTLILHWLPLPLLVAGALDWNGKWDIMVRNLMQTANCPAFGLLFVLVIIEADDFSRMEFIHELASYICRYA